MNINVFETINGWVTRQWGSSSDGGASFAYLFFGGLLASLLPCVYPLYPITATILRNRRGSARAFVHPLVYYAGLALVYFGFGLVAGVTGGAFNGLLRVPAVNVAIGIVLLLLSLSTVHFLEFPTLSSSAGEQDASPIGTMMMGAGAGLLSSACVGPVVVSILVAVAANADHVSLGVMVGAALKMLVFGLGVGFPILLVGLVGVKLPRGGRWMTAVQWVFAIAIGYFAIAYIVKGMTAWGFSDAIASATVMGAALVVAAAYLFQDSSLPATARMRKSLVLVAGITGALVMARNLLNHAPEAVAATLEARTGEPVTEKKGNLTWYLDREAAYRAAVDSGKPVFVDFHGDWCTNCKAFQERILSEPALNVALQKAVLLRVNDGSALFRRFAEDSRFPELKVGLPFFIITDAKGDVIYKTSDVTQTDEMILVLSG